MNVFWSEREKKDLEIITSFKEAAEIAVPVLYRMRLSDDNSPIYQICGPISTGGLGSTEANLCFFNRAIQVAEYHGLLVFDQLPFQEAFDRIASQSNGDYCTDILDIFYREVFGSGLIDVFSFLRGWGTSKGSTWEREIASKFGIRVEDYPMEWLPEIDTLEACHRSLFMPRPIAV